LKPLHTIAVPKGPLLSVMSLASAAACHGEFDVVISIMDPSLRLEWSHPRHTVFRMSTAVRPGLNTADARFIEGLFAVDLTGASSVLIHCRAGLERSPAAAMVLALKLGAGLKVIERGIDWEIANPNPLILALGEDQLKSGPVLRAMAERHA